jgi:hypothetical protein
VTVAASTFEWVQVVGGTVAALAALGTVVAAALTVRAARAVRRDERRTQLLNLAADYAEAGLRSLGASTPQRKPASE